jgi:hypothetical protein
MEPLHCPPHISPKRRDKLRASSPLELLGFPVVFKCGANSLSRASKDSNGETALKHCSVLFMKHVLPRLHKPTTPRAKGCPISFSGILAGLCCFLSSQNQQQETTSHISNAKRRSVCKSLVLHFRVHGELQNKLGSQTRLFNSLKQLCHTQRSTKTKDVSNSNTCCGKFRSHHPMSVVVKRHNVHLARMRSVATHCGDPVSHHFQRVATRKNKRSLHQF